MGKRALITGITGQDGSYLAEILLEKGYEVHGIIRRSSSFNTARIEHLYNDPEIFGKKLFLYYGDVVDSSSLNRLLERIEPDEVYNLAAQSHVKVSFEIPDYTAQVDALGTLRFLDAIKEVGLINKVRFYQASTSELYGKVQEIPQDENTPFYPRSPYGVAKLYAYWITRNYREAYGVYAVNGILFNHESPRRGETFVTRKITRGVARILLGLEDKILLGNLNASRDWGYAPEYCEGMWRMLQLEKPEDFVLATGEAHTIREFCENTFLELGIRLEWKGNGLNEQGVIKFVDEEIFENYFSKIINEYSAIKGLEIQNFIFDKVVSNIRKLLNSAVIFVSEKYFRPTEVDLLIGNPKKAKEKLNWTSKTTFKNLIKIMLKHDILRELKINY